MTPKRVLRLKNKRAVSAVISNLILIVAVIVIGFSVLMWSQNQSSNYQKAQANIISQDINQLQERLALEYTYYTSGTLKMYLLNCGSVNVTLNRIYLSSAPSTPITPVLYDFSNSLIESNTLMPEGEGYVQIPVSSALTQGAKYDLTISTARGSSFVFSFVA
jgi:hypothetical protein